MAIHPRRKSDAARRANQIVRSRTVLVMLLLGIVTFAALFWRLYDLQIRQHAELQEKAISQQTRSAVVSASRGTIYDRNLNTLAISATAETVLVSPLDIEKSVESQKEEQAKAAQKAAEQYQQNVERLCQEKISAAESQAQEILARAKKAANQQ